MKFLRKFNEHTSYEAELNVGGQDFEIPNVSYCKNVDDVHFNPYNLIEFYVGEITGPQKVEIYTDDATNHIEVTVSERKKWYSYVLPKDKELCMIEGDSVKNVNVKADISYNYNGILTSIIPNSVVEASFKGSNTSNVTDMSCMFDGCRGLISLGLSGWDTSKVTSMSYMFNGCSGLTSLDLSGWNMSKVTYMRDMFKGCSKLKTIRMKDCSEATRTKIQEQLTTDGVTGATITTK